MKASRRIALIAALAAVALTIFVAESQIPPVVPMPGVKLGLANIVTLVAIVLLNRRDALFVLAVRLILGAAFTGGFSAFLFSAVGGLFAYLNMGKLEDAPFTIKQALVTTSYPGASPMEVREQVTDILEEAIQSLGELYYLKSDNRAGLSKITVYVKKEIRAEDMQQLWDKLRRKVGDAQ